MRKFFLKNFLSFAVALGLVVTAITAKAYIITVPSVFVTKATCPADGTTTPTLSVTDGINSWYASSANEEVFICFAATCASGGIPIVVGNPVIMEIAGGTTISCRSAGGTGSLRIVQARIVQ